MDIHHILSAAAGLLLALGGIILSLCSVLIELIHPPHPSYPVRHTRPLSKYRRRSFSSHPLSIHVSESGHSEHTSSTDPSFDAHSIQQPPKSEPSERAPARHTRHFSWHKPFEHKDANNKRCLFHRHSTGSLRRSDTASFNGPPKRTDPYGAPYFFPFPGSPEAERYAERVRQEKRQSATSVGIGFMKKRNKKKL